MNTAKLAATKEKYEQLGKMIGDPSIIADNKEWTKLVREHSTLEPVVLAYDRLLKAQRGIEDAKHMIATESDPDMVELAEVELSEQKVECEKILEELKVLLLPVDPNDEKDVIVEVRAGTGGEEASLFAAQLMRMYKMYAAAHRMKVEDIDINETELGGVKEAVFQVSGDSVFRKLDRKSVV